MSEIFDAMLLDDGHRSALPVRASIINDYWLRIGSDDMRQILGTRFLDDQTTFYVTSSRLNAAVHAQRLGEAVAAGRQLQVALGKLDPADRTPATMLTRALSRWLDARARGDGPPPGSGEGGDDMTDIVAQVLARVHHWQDDRGQAYCLQIELGNDHAITLTVSEKERPSVDVWHGQGEHSFVRTDIDPGETLESFREFVAEAFEPPAEQGTKGLPKGSRR